MITIPFYNRYYEHTVKNTRLIAEYRLDNDHADSIIRYNWIHISYDVTNDCLIYINCGKTINNNIDLFNYTYNKNITTDDFIISKDLGITIININGLTREELVIFKLMVF